MEGKKVNKVLYMYKNGEVKHRQVEMGKTIKTESIFQDLLIVSANNLTG